MRRSTATAQQAHYGRLTSRALRQGMRHGAWSYVGNSLTRYLCTSLGVGSWSTGMTCLAYHIVAHIQNAQVLEVCSLLIVVRPSYTPYLNFRLLPVQLPSRALPYRLRLAYRVKSCRGNTTSVILEAVAYCGQLLNHAVRMQCCPDFLSVASIVMLLPLQD